MANQVEIGGIAWDPKDTATLDTDDIPAVVEAVKQDSDRIIGEIDQHVLEMRAGQFMSLTVALENFSDGLQAADELASVSQALAGEPAK